MLKNKKAVYLLIPLNIAIWGYLSYSIYSGLKGEDLPELTENITQLKSQDLKDTVDYILQLNYKDPFLREGEKIKSTIIASNSQKSNLPVKPQKPEPAKPSTDIKYLGLVKNNNTGVSTALISINGISHLVKKGDLVEGFSVKNISSVMLDLKEGKKSISVAKN